MNSITRSFLSLLTSSWLLFLMAAPPPIGVIRSSGDFQVDGSAVWGNATLFDGSTIQTATNRSRIRLSSGAEIDLAADSRAQVYRDHTILQQGAESVKNGHGLRTDAGTLRITPADAYAVADIVALEGNRVSVSAREGPVDVRNGAGVLVAVVRPGLALAFAPQAGGAATATKMGGCLVKKGDKYLMTDGTTNVTVELQGSEVAKMAGHQVSITGSMIPGATPASGATQVVQVATVESTGAACKVSATGAVIAVAGGAGLSAGVIVAIVGGVAAVGATAGLAAAGTFSSSRRPVSHF